MEGFEHVCKIALESEGFAVSTNLKFPVFRPDVGQTNSFEVDLVGAKSGRLVLASVKSFFGSDGVAMGGFRGLKAKRYPKKEKKYVMFNDPEVQHGIISQAMTRFGYREDEIQLRLYVGRFIKGHGQAITQFLASGPNGLRPVQVIGIAEIIASVRAASTSSTYVDDPVVALMKALDHAGELEKDS